MCGDGDLVMRKQDWLTLGLHPDWMEAGRIILMIDPLANLKSMSLRDIAEFFQSNGIPVPQGGRAPHIAITDEEYESLTGGAH
jgi:hypothetical protein